MSFFKVGSEEGCAMIGVCLLQIRRSNQQYRLSLYICEKESVIQF
jgi:hypothetical protein